MKQRSGISLSTLLLIVFVIIGGGATLLVQTTMRERQQAVVSKLGAQESQRTAEQIHQHLYSVMRAGLSRAELNETIGRIARVYPDIEIRVVRGEGVADQYGDDAESAQARRDDPLVRIALATGKHHLTDTETLLRYLMPMANQAECVACHSNAEHSINGLIDIRMPPEKLRAPIEATLSPLFNLISLLLVAIFLIVFLLLRNQIVHPIVQLSRHVTEITRDVDNAPGLGIRRIWPREIRLLASAYNRMLHEVQISHRRLTELAVRDKLTGLYNRHYFDEMLARTLDQAERKQQQVCLLMLDLDDFKPVNDHHGHAMGDKVLADVGRAIQGLTRTGDISSRVGGDEFLVIATDCAIDVAMIQADRLSEAISALSWQVDHETIRVGVSIGLAVYPGDARTADGLLAHADRAMYRNKRARKQAGRA